MTIEISCTPDFDGMHSKLVWEIKDARLTELVKKILLFVCFICFHGGRPYLSGRWNSEFHNLMIVPQYHIVSSPVLIVRVLVLFSECPSI